MILPDRVFGMSGTIQTFCGRAILPISVSIARLTFRPRSPGSARLPGLSETYISTDPAAHVVDDRDRRRLGDLGDGEAADSISLVPSRCPATLMTSSTRPRIRK
jgi:hypothetical protein